MPYYQASSKMPPPILNTIYHFVTPIEAVIITLRRSLTLRRHISSMLIPLAKFVGYITVSLFSASFLA